MFQSLKIRFGLSHVLPVLILAPLLGFILLYLLETQYFLTNFATELMGQGELAAQFLRDDPSLWTDPAQAQQAVDRLQPSASGRLMLLDAQYHLLGSGLESDQERIGQIISANVLDPSQPDQIIWHIVDSINMHERVVDVAVPVLDTDGKVLGVIRLSQSVGQLIERVLPLRRFVVGSLLLAISFATVLGLFLARSLGLPLARLARVVIEFEPGGLSRPIPETGPDTIRALAVSFNQMANRLHKSETEKRYLLAGIAHELGTSLGGIKAAAQALQRGAARDPDLVVELADGIYHQVDHLGLLVNDLSLFNETRQSHDVILHYQWIDIHDLIYHKCRTYIHIIEQKGVTLVIEIDKDLTSFQADEMRMCQIFGNLLHNAYKFTPAAGQITFTATLQQIEHQPDQVCFHITDTGPGVAPGEQQQIFEMFYRSSAAQSGIEGSGIGLALAKQLAETHGGSLTVESQPGHGATFTLQLPLEQPVEKGS